MQPEVKDIAIYGAGGFGREVSCIIKAINDLEKTWKIIGFFDDRVKAGVNCKYGNVLGTMELLNKWPTELGVVFAIGSGTIVNELVSKITNPNVSYPNIIAPNVQFFDSEEFSIGQGNIITFGCRISTGVSLGDFNILNGCVSLGHDVSIGNYNVMFPETRISGMTSIGNNNFFGAKSFVAQMLMIPDNVKISAGAILLTKPKAGNLYMGNPAKIVKI